MRRDAVISRWLFGLWGAGVSAVVFGAGCGGGAEVAAGKETAASSRTDGETAPSSEAMDSKERSAGPHQRRRRRDADSEGAVWGGFELRRNPVATPSRYQTAIKDAPLEIVVQDGHTERITAAEFNADGSLLFTASQDRKVKVWTKDGVLLRNIVVPAGGLDWLKVMPDGDTFWTGDGNAAFKYDVMGHQQRVLSGEKYAARLIAASPDGKRIITVDQYAEVTIRDSEFEPIKTFPAHKYALNTLAYSPRGDYFVTGGPQGELENGVRSAGRIWSPDGTLIADIEVQKPKGLAVAPGDGGRRSTKEDPLISEIEWIDISPDGRTIAVVGNQNRINFWSQKGAVVRQLKRDWHDSETANRCAFTPDGQSVLLVMKKSLVKIGLDGRGEGGFTLIHKQQNWANAGAFAVAPDASVIVLGMGKQSGDAQGELYFFDRFGHPAKSIEMDAPLFGGIAVSPDRRQLVLERERGKASLLFDTGRNTVDAIAESMGFYRDDTGYKFATDKNFTIVDRRGQRSLKIGWGSYAIPLPDGNLAVVSRGANHAIEIYAPDGSPLRTVKYNGHGKGLGPNIAVSPDMTYFAVETGTSHGGYHGVTCIGLEHGQPIATFDVKAPFEKLAVGPDSRTVAVGHENGDISLWTRDGAPIKVLKGHATLITGLAFDKGGRYLVSTSKDRTVRVWDIDTGRWTALVVLANNEWVAFDEAGRFDCSSGGRDRVRLVRGLSVFDFRQLWDDFFTPGLMSRVLKGARFERIDAALKLEKAPAVSIALTKAPRPGTTDSTATLSVCATSKGSPVGDIFVFHNGRAVEGTSRGIRRVKRDSCQDFVVELTPGNNTFVGAAYDATKVIFGQSAALRVPFTPKAIARPSMYILAVGISEYRDRNISLVYPADDARSISKALEDVAVDLYGNVIVETLVNRQATRLAIQKKLDRIAKQADAPDAVILYFAGHGETEKGAYYFLSHDADVTDLEHSALGIDDLSRFARETVANKIAIFLDTCKSGAATKEIGKLAMARSIEERKIIATLAKERGIAVFSAAGTDQLAFEISALKHGIFTYCMLDYLENKQYDVASNDMISISKLLSMVSRATRALASKHLKAEQTPILYMFGDDFSIGYLR